MPYTPRGIYAAMVTPYTEGGSAVDLEKVPAIVKQLHAWGVHGLFIAGTTGEGLLMSADERMQLLETALAAKPDGMRAIGHVGAIETGTAVKLAKHAAGAGVEAVSAVVPPFYIYDDDSVYAYYAAVRDAANGVPVLAYNIPSCTQTPLSLAVVERMCADGVVAGAKDSSGDMDYLQRMLRIGGDSFAVMNGADHYGLYAFLHGCPGAVSGMANVAGDVYAAVFELLQDRDHQGAVEAQERLSQACLFFEYGRLLSKVKEGMRARGVDGGCVRPPQRELTAMEAATVREGLKGLGLA